MTKTIKIVIEDTTKGKVEIPLTRRQVSDFYDLSFMLMGSSKTITEISALLNKKWGKVLDALHEGKCYEMKGKMFIESKYKFYHSGRKPKWQ